MTASFPFDMMIVNQPITPITAVHSEATAYGATAPPVHSLVTVHVITFHAGGNDTNDKLSKICIR